MLLCVTVHTVLWRANWIRGDGQPCCGPHWPSTGGSICNACTHVSVSSFIFFFLCLLICMMHVVARQWEAWYTLILQQHYTDQSDCEMTCGFMQLHSLIQKLMMKHFLMFGRDPEIIEHVIGEKRINTPNPWTWSSPSPLCVCACLQWKASSGTPSSSSVSGSSWMQRALTPPSSSLLLPTSVPKVKESTAYYHYKTLVQSSHSTVFVAYSKEVSGLQG